MTSPDRAQVAQSGLLALLDHVCKLGLDLIGINQIPRTIQCVKRPPADRGAGRTSARALNGLYGLNQAGLTRQGTELVGRSGRRRPRDLHEWPVVEF